MKRLLILLALTISFIVNAQINRANNWVTGYSGNRVNFNGNSIITSQGLSPFKYFTAGNSCISDMNGNLVLASDGFNLYKNTGSYLEEGDTLVPNYYYTIQNGWSAGSQTSIFLPMDSNKYYFVTPTFSDLRYYDCHNNNGNCYFDLLLYNVIDMNANGGLGKVTKRMVPLMQNANLRKTQMMACRHGNGKDWWLLKNEGDYGNVHTFLFTQDSVYDKGVQVFAQPYWGNWDLRGQSAFNSDGSMFASTSDGSGALSSLGLVFLADFDRCHGLLSNPRVLDMPWGSQHNPNDTSQLDKQSVGLAFSPNNQFLYVISYTNVYQYNLQDNTWFHVAGLDTVANAAQGYETAYLGPDGKIYIGNFGGLSKQMSRIDNPDVKGAGCNFCPRCLRLDSLGANAYMGTPPCMPNYGLGAKTCWPLAAEDVLVGDDHLAVYPNPTNSILNVKNKTNQRKYLYNTLGQLIRSTQSNEMDIRGVPPGVYYVQCDGETRKVVVE
jgi:hypothetical protein